MNAKYGQLCFIGNLKEIYDNYGYERENTQF